MPQSLQLSSQPDAVHQARLFVSAGLPPGLVAARDFDAQLVASELTTNALIHAGPPVTVRVLPISGGVRIEVEDRSRVAPLRGLGSAGAITGRGIALVEEVCERWGVTALPDGKVVWAELSGVAADSRPDHRSDDVDRVLDPWPVPSDGINEPRFTVELGDVPTELLIAAKGHVDGLLREFTLISFGAAAGSTAAVPTALANLMRVVTTRFAEPRHEIKRQALAAAAAGQPRTRLTLWLPLAAADAGRDYLAAMDEADTYARAARLLTLETPPQHRAFRRWYVTALINQLEEMARGRHPSPPTTFEEHLLSELATVTAAQRAGARAASLQAITASLAGASALEDVASLVVTEGVATLEASGGGLMVPAGGKLFVAGTVGYEPALIEQLLAESADAQLPAAAAMRSGEPIWLESREERDRDFPRLTGMEPTIVSMCAVPLTADRRILGALRFSFDAPRLFDQDERRFVLALAAQAAQALDRVQLYESEQLARARAETAAQRLTRLHDVTAALAGAREAHTIAQIVAGEAGVTLGADLAALCVLDDDRSVVRVIAMHGARPETLERWSTFPLAADLPASECIRTQLPIVAHGREELERRYPHLGGAVREGTLACAPFQTSYGGAGALSLIFPTGHVVDDQELALLVTIANQCGLALERAELFAAERAARDRAAFMADATGLLTASLEPAETMRRLSDILVPAFADWATIHVLEPDGRVRASAVTHRDPTAEDALRRLAAERPVEVEAPGSLGEALRPGRSILLAELPEAMRARFADVIGDERLLADLVPSTAIVVPLVARGAVLGVVTLARTAGPPYIDADLHLVEDIGARAAVAMANAELYARERESALMLQRSLLPQLTPDVEGLDLAWRYLPGAAGTHVGGDWYDVIALDDGTVALVIGDVMGRGLRAAAVMGQLRATARAHAHPEVEPRVVLAHLDAALSRLEQDQITTALFALLDPVTRTITVASAGHLPPLVTSPGGGAEYLDVRPGPPLGTGEAVYPQLTAVLPEGAMLLLYTDGLVEDRRLPVDVGLRTLLTAATGSSSAEDLCARVLHALGRDSAHEDDTAILAVAWTGNGDQDSAMSAPTK